MDWPQTIRSLAANRQQSLRQLSGVLGVSQQFLSDVVNGKKAATWRLKLSILAAVGYDGPRDELLELLLSDEAAEAVRQWEIDRGVARAARGANKRKATEERQAAREHAAKKKAGVAAQAMLPEPNAAH